MGGGGRIEEVERLAMSRRNEWNETASTRGQVARSKKFSPRRIFFLHGRTENVFFER